MLKMGANDPVAAAVVAAIQRGDVDGLRHLFQNYAGVATARIVDACGAARTRLHIAADWPGHFPRGAETVAVLIAAGGDVNAPVIGPHSETPLHWAASSDDVAVLDA